MRNLLSIYWADVAWVVGGAVGAGATAGKGAILSLPAVGFSDKFEEYESWELAPPPPLVLNSPMNNNKERKNIKFPIN